MVVVGAWRQRSFATFCLSVCLPHQGLCSLESVPRKGLRIETRAQCSSGDKRTPSWADIVDNVSCGQLARFSRSDESQAAYEKFKTETLREWESLADFLACEILGIESRNSGRRVAALELERLEPPQRVWRPNDFPYLLPSDVSHYVVWCSHAHLLEQNGLLDFIAQQLTCDADVVCWINPPGLKSVPRFPHAHVLFRPISSIRPATAPGNIRLDSRSRAISFLFYCPDVSAPPE